MARRWLSWGLCVLGATTWMVACGDKKDNAGVGPERRGSPPPPAAAPASASASARACTREIADDRAKAFLPGRAAGFCLDPKDGDKSFGKGTPNPLEAIADLFDGESKNYEDYGVGRVVHARYVAERGSTSIDVNASEFVSERNAYAMFTKRVVGDGDPADEATPKKAEMGADAIAVLGTGNAYVVRGKWLLEVVYNDDTATPAQLERDGNKALTELLSAIVAKIPGASPSPPEVAALPAPDRIPMGVRYRLAVPFPGLAGEVDRPDANSVGGAVGYYRSGERRYRISAVKLADEAAAKSLFDQATKQPGATAREGAGDQATRYTFKEGALEGEVLVARKGNAVYAVWDELRVLRGGMPDAERAKLSLTSDDKLAKLKELAK